MPDADQIMGEHEKISKEELIILLRRQKMKGQTKISIITGLTVKQMFWSEQNRV